MAISAARKHHAPGRGWRDPAIGRIAHHQIEAAFLRALQIEAVPRVHHKRDLAPCCPRHRRQVDIQGGLRQPGAERVLLETMEPVCELLQHQRRLDVGQGFDHSRRARHQEPPSPACRVQHPRGAPLRAGERWPCRAGAQSGPEACRRCRAGLGTRPAAPMCTRLQADRRFPRPGLQRCPEPAAQPWRWRRYRGASLAGRPAGGAAAGLRSP